MRLRKGTIPFCACEPQSINIQVLFCVTALQDITQLHLRTGGVVRLFMTSQHFSSDRYRTWAMKQSYPCAFHLMADYHIHIHDNYGHVKARCYSSDICKPSGDAETPAIVGGNYEVTATNHQQTENRAYFSLSVIVISQLRQTHINTSENNRHCIVIGGN